MQMITLKETYNVVNDTMKILENINLYEVSSRTQRILNQQKIHKAYRKLDSFRDELIRENIKNKQNKEETNDR